MSNKTEEARAKPTAKPALVPKLRFPEFRDAGEWAIQPMSELYTFKGTNSLSRDKLNYEIGLVKNIHYGDIHTKFPPHFEIQNEVVPYVNPSESLSKVKTDSYCIEGDMIFADASEDTEDIGKCIEVITLNNERLLAGLHTILARQKEKRIIIGFGGHLFRSERIREQIQNESQGTKVLGISVGRLSRIEICYPKNKAEQQKIADCLSSIDELITLETQKIDALKAHKKGLMQQLFPAEGEILPKLRFPEFRDAGDWDSCHLGGIAHFSSGGTPSKGVADYWGGAIPWISASSMYETNISKSNLNVTALAIENGTRIAKKGSLLVLVRGSMLFNRIPMGIATTDVAFNQDVKALEIVDKLSNLFLLFQLISFESRIPINETGIGAGKIETEDLKNLVVFVPSINEQQKIADCLSSIDELIALEAQKLDALKVHKKGLMQQLFPVSGEVRK